MSWKTLIAVVSAELDQELARQIDFLKAEKKILKQQVKGRIRLNDTDGNRAHGERRGSGNSRLACTFNAKQTT